MTYKVTEFATFPGRKSSIGGVSTGCTLEQAERAKEVWESKEFRRDHLGNVYSMNHWAKIEEEY